MPLEYLSPTSLGIYYEDPERFYRQYMSVNKMPRDPQTQPMSIGSAFDAYVKSYLHECLYGKNNDPKFAFDAIFNAQVEEHNRKWARDHGKYCFEQYKSSGALADLMLELSNGSDQRFEFEVRGTVNGYREGNSVEIAGVTLLGKPDVSFITSEGAHVILDFKVNGYCSKASPAPGYVRMRGAGRTNFGHHKNAFPMKENGILINVASTLETIKEDWANQLAIYGWLCGQPVGSDFIVAIDQLACVSSSVGLPTIRVAEHRIKISPEHQMKVFNRCCELWDIVHSDHFFRDMSLEDSIARCQLLDAMSSVMIEDEWFNSVTRRNR